MRDERDREAIDGVVEATATARVTLLEELPDEIIPAIVQQLACDDYHMLTVPLISHAFRRSCQLPAGDANRLASRLRQVVDGVVLPATRASADGHAFAEE